MVAKGDILTLNPHAIGAKGEAIAKHEGLVVFIYGAALPGEEVRVEITDVKKNYAHALLREVVHPSEDRIEPPCPYFGECGGCQIMHWNYSRQLQYKQQKVIDALERIGGFKTPDVKECVASPKESAYRNKIQMPVVTTDSKFSIGLYAAYSHDVVPIDSCYIHCKMGEKIYRTVVEVTEKYFPLKNCWRHFLIKSAVRKEEALVVFITTGLSQVVMKKIAHDIMEALPEVVGVVENINRRKDNVILGNQYHTLLGRDWIEEELLGMRFRISPHAFFQVNTDQAEQLYKKVIDLLEPDKAKKVLDAYCGVGTLSILLSSYASSVVGIEYVETAVQDARKNAELNGCKNIRFQSGKVEDLIATIEGIDSVVLNPPRKGCDDQVIHSLLKQLPQNIVYVSCNPATLARDLQKLSLKYQIDYVEPFDMFPQTTHVETVVKLSILT